LNEKYSNRDETIILKNKLYSNFDELIEQNKINIFESKVFLYSSILHLELLKAERTSRTSINVEIDQVASVTMFMGLFFRNKKLAKVSNLLGGEFQCPYKYIMDYMKENFKSSADVEYSEKGFYLITQDRKITKQATMSYGYSDEGCYGRVDDLLKIAREVYPGTKDKEMEDFLKDYAKQFCNHFNIIFPNIITQINILKKICILVVTETSFMCFDNLLGVRLT
jgi:hypothetical protein